ncbi:hypothetical protein [Sideroxydans sp. CL21]|nr:hypothetical protein [Sideroxydans sp. CL21]
MQCLQFVKQFLTDSNQSEKLPWYQGVWRILIDGMVIANNWVTRLAGMEVAQKIKNKFATRYPSIRFHWGMDKVSG